MDVSSFMGGNFFSQVDLASPVQVMTINKVDQQLVGQGPQAEQKICVSFNESAKPLALNKTNLKRVAALYSTDANQWPGKQLLVYRSSTTFSGQPKLCVRICGAQQTPPDPICDQQGNAVAFQPQAVAPAPVPQAAPQPIAVPQAAAPLQAPVAQPQQASPWQGAPAQPQQPGVSVDDL